MCDGQLLMFRPSLSTVRAAAKPRSHSIVYGINGPLFFGVTQKFTGITPKLRRTLRGLRIGSARLRFAPSVETAAVRAALTRDVSPAG
jgi:hypothetical protein